MDSGMIVMDRVDSDKLKPYLRGGSDDGSTNDPSLLHDSHGSADQSGPPSFPLFAGEANQWMGKSVVRGPQSDLLGALEELEREAEAEAAAGKVAGGVPLWPAPQAHDKVLDELEDGYVDTNGIRPVHSESQQKPNNKGSPSAGKSLMQSLSAELPMPPPRLPAQTPTPITKAQTPTPATGSSARAREPTGQKAVLAGQTLQGDSTTMPFKPKEPFDLAAVAHQHLLDLALNDLSPPASDQEPANKPAARVHGHKPGPQHSAGPGPKTIRNGLLKDVVNDRETPSPCPGTQVNNRSIIIPTASSSGAGTPGISPGMPTPALSAPKTLQSASPAPGSSHTPPVIHRSGIPTALAIPRAEQSRDAFNKTIHSTMSPTASGMLATVNPPDVSNLLSPRLNHSPRPSRSPALNASDSTSLLPSPPARASHVDVNFRSQSSFRAWGSDMGGSVSRIPRSPADASPSLDMTSMSLQLFASKLPALKKSGGSRPLSHRGSKIPLSPAGSIPGGSSSSRRAASLTPRGRKKEAPSEKQGQAMEAATAELDRLAVMLKQMQEDIKAIPTEPIPNAEVVQPIPTSAAAAPGSRKAAPSRVRAYLEDAEQSVALAQQNHSSPPQAVETPDNEPLDKAEKMQETSTTVTVAGAKGVRRPLHDAVAEEAVQGLPQSLPQSLPQASGSLSEISSHPLSKASAKRSADEGVSRATSAAAVSREVSTGGMSKGASTAGVSMSKGQSGSVSKGLSGAVPKVAAAPVSQGTEVVTTAVKKEQNDRDSSSNSSAVAKARKQLPVPKPVNNEKSESSGRRKRSSAKLEQTRKSGSGSRAKGASSGHVFADDDPAQDVGGNQLEGQAPVLGDPAYVPEVEGTGGRGEAVVVHASSRPVGDLEALEAAKQRVEQASQADKQLQQQPVEHTVVQVKPVDPNPAKGKPSDKLQDQPQDSYKHEPQDKHVGKGKGKVQEVESADADQPVPLRCACCFM